MSKKAIKNLLSYNSERVIYISCSYINAIRDIKDMTGYNIDSITPFDMFPKTHHTECVVLMGKTVTRSKSHVNLGLDVEDYYKIEDAEKEQE